MVEFIVYLGCISLNISVFFQIHEHERKKILEGKRPLREKERKKGTKYKKVTLIQSIYGTAMINSLEKHFTLSPYQNSFLFFRPLSVLIYLLLLRFSLNGHLPWKWFHQNNFPSEEIITIITRQNFYFKITFSQNVCTHCV